MNNVHFVTLTWMSLSVISIAVWIGMIATVCHFVFR